ncbi:Uncharacterized conserved protein, DUF2252 family [Variovorax sp. CF079]|uniref:DUF2252 domain-containing protein n=1 Tax=Variovorax sp. CF079 TaxID=1882774 RepID=UPI00088FD0BA|nr:DUF2252 family protein [Variovorax sp. CF079]SDC06763.1 Uncharacterized conserved protein, DUF2252 family [Variovorax sp. CF079]
MIDVARSVQAFNAGRDPERLQMKYEAMRKSPFVFLRGSCHRFYERLAPGVLPASPLGWVCGDLHLENFGSFKGDNGLVYFDINDFDESALAPTAWDLVRFLASVRVGAATLSLRRQEAQQLCRAFLDAYAETLAQGEVRWVERDTADGLVGALLRGLRERKRVPFLDERTKLKRTGGKRSRFRRKLRTDGKKALPASREQRASVTEAIRSFAEKQPNPDYYRVLDVARRIAGTGSLGVERYVILVNGKGSPGGNGLLDLKQVNASSLLAHLKTTQPAWKNEAQRAVALQQRVQAVSAGLLQPLRMGRAPFVLRHLQPSEDRVTLDRSAQKLKTLEQVLRTMGRMVAWGQLRSAGRQGSAIADELVAHGHSRKWRQPLLDASRDCAADVAADWKAYGEAFDDGAFTR